MIRFRSLLASELRRCLSRRAVHVLVVVAVVGIAVMAIATVVTVDPANVTPPLRGNEWGDGHIANLADLWMGDGDGNIVIPITLLGIGAMLGGALVVGGEWKAGTVVTLATWEVRRRRLLAARLLACGILAPAIGAGLLALFVLGTLPVVLAKGSTDGIDGEWIAGIAGAVGRGLGMVSFAALVGGAIANVARSATAAFVVLFALNAVVEPTIRSWFPSMGQWLLGENLTALVGGQGTQGEGFERTPAVAGLVLGIYLAALVFGAMALFRRRDLGSAT
jgi:hypothetical protein